MTDEYFNKLNKLNDIISYQNNLLKKFESCEEEINCSINMIKRDINELISNNDTSKYHYVIDSYDELEKKMKNSIDFIKLSTEDLKREIAHNYDLLDNYHDLIKQNNARKEY